MAIDTVIVGLGNPGARYERTRHNAGFLLVGELAAAHGIGIRQERHGALVGDGGIGEHRCLVALPQTYMNRSGESVRRLLSFTGLDPDALVVVHDDMDLPLGRLRLRRGGGAGGHRGIASLLEQLGTPEFTRLKIGVGRPPDALPAEAYVLQEFAAPERDALREALVRGAAALEVLLDRGLEAAMNVGNSCAPGSGMV
ncbi:MAG: aminoacyl-tRNA hydrolase [Candidatus Methylomirabilia bacterium]